jgi:hypothetical protein
LAATGMSVNSLLITLALNRDDIVAGVVDPGPASARPATFEKRQIKSKAP